MDRKYFTKDEDFLLSPHFKMSEMTFNVGGRYVMPDDECKFNLTRLCFYHLDMLRSCFGPIVINSGYRDAVKNAAVKGALHSYHLYGCACDIRVPSVYWGIRYASFLLENNESVIPKFSIAELILHKKQNYIHLAMRKAADDIKFYVDIL